MDGLIWFQACELHSSYVLKGNSGIFKIGIGLSETVPQTPDFISRHSSRHAEIGSSYLPGGVNVEHPSDRRLYLGTGELGRF